MRTFHRTFPHLNNWIGVAPYLVPLGTTGSVSVCGFGGSKLQFTAHLNPTPSVRLCLTDPTNLFHFLCHTPLTNQHKHKRTTYTPNSAQHNNQSTSHWDPPPSKIIRIYLTNHLTIQSLNHPITYHNHLSIHLPKGKISKFKRANAILGTEAHMTRHPSWSNHNSLRVCDALKNFERSLERNNNTNLLNDRCWAILW